MLTRLGDHTWVRRLDAAELRRRVVSVHAVQEHQAGVAVAPGVLHDLAEDVPGTALAGRLARPGVHQIVGLVTLDRLHEALGHGNADVEVLECRHVGLHVDERLDVRMVDAEDRHVGAAARPALLDGLRRCVVDAHEGDGATGDAAGAGDPVARRAQPAEGEAGTAATLVDQCGVLEGAEDPLHRILDRKHEAGGELLQRPSRVPQGR